MPSVGAQRAQDADPAVPARPPLGGRGGAWRLVDTGSVRREGASALLSWAEQLLAVSRLAVVVEDAGPAPAPRPRDGRSGERAGYDVARVVEDCLLARRAVVVDDLSPTVRAPGSWAAVAVVPAGGAGEVRAVCALDAAPRRWSTRDLDLLRGLAARLALLTSDDSTGRDHVTAGLEASEARLRALVDLLATESWYCGPGGQLLTDLPAWRAVTGQSAQELAGDGWLRAVHPDDRDRVEREWRHAVDERRPYRCEYRIVPVAGTEEERSAGTRTVVAHGVPMWEDDQVLDWVGVYVDVTEQRTAERERQRLTTVAARAADRTRRLQQLTAALSGALTVSDVLSVILREGQTAFAASGSGVALREGDLVRYQALNGYNSDVTSEWTLFPLSEPSPVTHVLLSGRPLFLSDAGEVLREFPTQRMATFLSASGDQALARLPLSTRGQVFGVLGLGFAEPRTFSPEDRRFLATLADQCAQALDRARLYEREANTARLLQRSLLPEALPTTADLWTAGRCQPASADVEVGGDWYDAFLLPDGRAVAVVGDVMGKGVAAASLMGQVRNALRGLVHADPDPAVLLDRLDTVVSHAGHEDALVTVVYVLLDASTGEVTYACAGHPPPLLLDPAAASEQARFLEDGRSTPLGLAGERPTGTALLGAGQTLLLYSDGLVETRSVPLLEGLPRLQEQLALLAPQSGCPEGLSRALLERMSVLDHHDDVTVLVLHRP